MASSRRCKNYGMYQEIMSDTKRRNAAMRQAKIEADNLIKRANAMKKAAGGRINKK